MVLATRRSRTADEKAVAIPGYTREADDHEPRFTAGQGCGSERRDTEHSALG